MEIVLKASNPISCLLAQCEPGKIYSIELNPVKDLKRDIYLCVRLESLHAAKQMVRVHDGILYQTSECDTTIFYPRPNFKLMQDD